jgi:undecaprenyl-diphosphatase
MTAGNPRVRTAETPDRLEEWMDTRNTPAGRRLPWIGRLVNLGVAARNHPAWPLALAAFLIIGAMGVFADLAEDVQTADHITVVDLQLANWLHAHATPALTQVMLAVSTLHGMLSMSILTVLLAILLNWRGERDRLPGLMLVVPGGIVLNTVLKFAFHRARPHFLDPIVTLTTYSFPSGHVAGSTLFYGFVAVLLIDHTRSRIRQVTVVIGALLMVGLVAASRMYLGAHFLSDVLAAFFESFAWLGFCLVGIHVIRQRMATRPERT